VMAEKLEKWERLTHKQTGKLVKFEKENKVLCF
jgi:hypothetical protein